MKLNLAGLVKPGKKYIWKSTEMVVEFPFSTVTKNVAGT
jgi:hypothetical protein